MPRPKKYEDDAARAAAWRQRQQQEQLQAAETVRNAEWLHHTLRRAAAGGDTEAASLIGVTVAETLKNLSKHFQKQPPP